MKIGRKGLRFVAAMAIMLSIALPGGDATMPVYAAGDGSVWICGGPNSKRYHRKRNCSGLKKCSKNPQQISLGEARKRGYTPCKKCYH